METDYEKMFKPYCIDYLSKQPDGVLKEQVDFIFKNKDEAFNLLQSVYDTGYGTINIDENLVSIHTGGWSENEAIIYEFKKTHWWTSNFRVMATGGHYYFDTDRNGQKEWDIVAK